MKQPFYDLAPQHAPLHFEIQQAIARVIARNHFILGEEVTSFEDAFSNYCGTRYCIGCSNGLDALQLILRAAGIGPGDEVIVPGHTFIATWLAVSSVGARPVAVDCEITSGNIDPSLVEKAITQHTRAIIAVHLYGRPANMTALRAIADKVRILLVEDAAQAHGANIHTAKTGGLGDAAAFSFYPTKNLGALGDGGTITTSNETLASKIRQIANYGSSQKYQHDAIGLNARLDEIQAAVLKIKLAHLDDWNKERAHLVNLYLKELADCTKIICPDPDSADIHSAWHLFVIRTHKRTALQTHLAEAGIQTMVHYPTPPYRQKAYNGFDAQCPQSDLWSQSALSLPLYPGLTEAAIQYITNTIKQCL